MLVTVVALLVIGQLPVRRAAHARRMSTIIEEIREKMARFPDARVEHDTSSITYLPSASDGFIVRLAVEESNGWERYTVYYNGSHEKFTHRGAAIRAFGFGLSTGCR